MNIDKDLSKETFEIKKRKNGKLSNNNRTYAILVYDQIITKVKYRKSNFKEQDTLLQMNIKRGIRSTPKDSSCNSENKVFNPFDFQHSFSNKYKRPS